jgi:hypothetical protein
MKTIAIIPGSALTISAARCLRVAVRAVLLFLLMWVFILPPVLVQAAQGTPDPATKPAIVANYGRIPLHFEPNQGQTDEAVKFLTRGHGYSLFMTSSEVVMTLRQRDKSAIPIDPGLLGPEHDPVPAARQHLKPDTSKMSVVRMQFPGAKPEAELAVEGLDPLPGRSNYFIGNDPAKWRTKVPHYGRVRYRNLYSGVDLVLHGNPQQLEYDFVVAPGADPNAIRLAFTGTDGITVDAEGSLVLKIAGGEIIQKAPKVYQVIDGVQQAVAGRYVLQPRQRMPLPLKPMPYTHAYTHIC